MKGISFNDVMARAWHEGRKPVTRRLMNPQPDGFAGNGDPFIHTHNGDRRKAIRYRYIPGETVYIKETWTTRDPIYDDDKQDSFSNQAIADPSMLIYRADGDVVRRWRSPRFMPEWAARSHAKIVSNRPERVREITDEEISAEGLDVNFHAGDIATASVHLPGKVRHSTARECFRSLWESIYPGSWERNDWVWRIELEKIP